MPLALWCNVAIVAAGAVTMAQFPLTGFGSQTLGHLLGAVALVVTVVAVQGLLRAETLEPIARTFWRRVQVAMGVLGLAFLAGGVFLIAHPVPATVAPDFPAYVMGPLALGAAILMVAVLSLPVGAHTRRDRVRLSIDAATALLGGGVLVYYIATSKLLTSDALIAAVGASVPAAGMVIKVLLDNGGPVERRTLHLLAWSSMSSSLSGVLIAVAPTAWLRVSASVILVPLSAALVSAAATRQRRVAAGTVTIRRDAHRRPQSPLPYLAIITVDVLVLRLAFDSIGPAGRVVLLATLSITALVVIQQFLALRENTTLLSDLRGQEERLQHEATHDALTGLANRSLFDERLGAAIRSGEPVAVLLIDLDDFKTVNDTLGHGTGSQLLAEFARLTRSIVREGDLAGRIGGDEFAVLLCGAQAAARGESVARRMLTLLETPVDAGEHLLFVQASIGVARSAPNELPEDVLRHADIAMYAAKERGKAGYVVYSNGMEEPVLAHMRLGGELHRALDNSEFFLVYQPIVDLATRRLIGAEALVRWQHPVRGLIPPIEFIAAAERTGLIVPLGRWVLREACRQVVAWTGEFGPTAPHKIGVNVSARQLHDPAFADEVGRALRDTGLAPERLLLELTESAALRGRQVGQTLRDLDRQGVKLALDDFGTGESSLSLLRSFPVSVIKLDKSFVDGIEHESATDAEQAVARAVAQLAASLGLDTVAEGVENETQARRLVEFGYTTGQGYHFAKPAPADEFATLLTRTNGVLAVQAPVSR